jgi:hypothetical protein
MSNITLKTISAPNLNDSGYGENIKTQFTNIDKNFRQIVEGEYLKGQSGDIVMLEQVNLADSSHPITALFNEYIASLQVGDDGIGGINSQKLYMIYTKNEETGGKVYKSSLPYTFLDPRFNPITEEANASQDKSCIIIYDEAENGFKSYNAFPNIYFNDDINEFCWKINNLETSLPARGPKGNKGDKGQVYMMTTMDQGNGGDGDSKIYKLGFLGDQGSITAEMNGCLAYIYCSDDRSGHISTMRVEYVESAQSYIATSILNDSTNLYTIFSGNSLKDVLSEVTPTADFNSIFIPIETTEEGILSHAITTLNENDILDFVKHETNPNTVIVSPTLIKDKGRELKSESNGYTLYNNYPTLCSQSMWVKRLTSPSIITPQLILLENDSFIRLNQWEFKSDYGKDGLNNLYLDCNNDREAGDLFVRGKKITTVNYVDDKVSASKREMEDLYHSFLTGEADVSLPQSDIDKAYTEVFSVNDSLGPMIQEYKPSGIAVRLFTTGMKNPAKNIQLGIALDTSLSKNYIYNFKMNRKYSVTLDYDETLIPQSLSSIPFYLRIIDVNGRKVFDRLTDINLCEYRNFFQDSKIDMSGGTIVIFNDPLKVSGICVDTLYLEIEMDVDFNNKIVKITISQTDKDETFHANKSYTLNFEKYDE